MLEPSRFGAPAAGGMCCAVMFAITCIALADDRLTPADDTLLRTMSDELVAAPRLEYDMTVNVRFTMTGWQQLTDTSLHVSAERPNRLAMRLERGVAGGTLVSDGETLWIYMPMQFAYQEFEAPETFKGMREVQSTFMSPDGAMSGIMFGVLLAQEDLYGEIMDGVTSVRRLERETVDGVACEVLEFTEDQAFTWKLAVTAEPPHRPRRCTVDISPWYESNAESNPAFRGATHIVTTSFNDWKMPAAFAADRFAFAPPEGAMNMSNEFDFEMGGSLDTEGNSKPHRLDVAWAAAGEFSGVAVDGERVFAVGSNGLVEFGPNGDVVRTVRRMVNPLDAGTIRLAELTGDDDPDFILFRQWGGDVYAFDSDGSELWTYPRGQGIDDVWPVDVDGDGVHEIAIGHNGNTGLHLVDASGEARWTNRRLGNVWHVTGGDLDGDGAAEVISTSAQGAVHVFDAAGKSVKTLRPSEYANMVRFVEAPASKTALLVCGGSEKYTALGLDATGTELWSTPLAGPTSSAAAARLEPWAAIAANNGAVEIVHLDSGDILGRLSAGRAPAVAWLETDGRSRLVVAASGFGVKAYDVVETEITSE